MATAHGIAAGQIIGTDDAVTIPTSVELAVLAESVALPLAAMDGAGALRGREEVVESFLSRFEDAGTGGRAHLLHGLGGSGKTSIAAEIARRVSAKGTAVWWVSAADNAGLVSGLHAVARLAGAGGDELRSDDAADVLWRRLGARREPWLLVVDNADDPHALDIASQGERGTLSSGRGWVRPFLGSHGFVIVTSRRGGDPASWGTWIAPHPVEMLAPADGAQVLLDRTRGRGGSRADANALAERLGGLPLALSLAGSYLAQSTVDIWHGSTAVTTFKGYHAALDEGRVDILEPRPGGEGHQQEEGTSHRLVDRNWQLAVHLLEDRGLTLAGRFMRLLAQFAPAPLPYQLILKQDALVDSPAFSALDRDQAGSLLRDMSNLGLVDLTPTAPGPASAEGDLPVLRVHPLMRDASSRYQDPVHDGNAVLAVAARLLVEAVAGESDFSPQDHRRWPLWRLVAPHAFHLLERFPKDFDDLVLVDRLARVAQLAAQYLLLRGLRAQARDEYVALHRACADLLGDEHARTLIARHGIASCTANGGEHAAAGDEFRSILDIQRRTLGEEHPDTLITRHNLAWVTGALGDYATARDEFRSILDIRSRVLGEEHPYTLATRNNLGTVFTEQGDHAAALEAFTTVLDVQRRILGEEHLDTLAVRNNVAKVLWDLGEHRTVQGEFRSILEIQRRILGEEHPATLGSRNNLAWVLSDRGEHTAAQGEFLSIVDIHSRILGSEHLNTLRARQNLAVNYSKMGRRREAETEMRAVLAVLEHVAGPDHPQTRLAKASLKAIRSGVTSTKRPVLWHGPGKRKKKR
ncbi:tetratricopeptide repeat protein [Saccharothrix xinjiangensis]|uniref:Tetratricopeptide repeat protein n=1 Tax=Saccharothrix xinjiangensis TaxID=204798 RepID=A0ABV9Y625_9PSEU